MKLELTSSGSFSNLDKFLRGVTRGSIMSQLQRYGQDGVNALASATPIESGETRNLWSFDVKKTGGSYSITWTNSHVENGVPIAIILQYGHGTGTGGYVQGRDYINPAMRPVFDNIADKVWKAVTSA